MSFGKISFTANSVQNPVTTRLNDINDRLFYTQQMDSSDSKLDKAAKNFRNTFTLEKLENLEGDDLKKAQLHNLAAMFLNPMVAPQAAIENVKSANSLLQKQKAVAAYQQSNI